MPRGTLAGMILNGGEIPTDSEDRCVWRLDCDSSLAYGSGALRLWASANGMDVPNVARAGVKIIERPDGTRWIEYDRLLGQPGARIYDGPHPVTGRPQFTCEHMRIPLACPPAALRVADAVVRLTP